MISIPTESQIKMKCPSCRSFLKKDELKRVQDTAEHVMNPNATPSLKQTFVCSNDSCTLNIENVFWLKDGSRCGGFSLNNDVFIDKNDAPFNTFRRKSNVENSYCNVQKSARFIQIGKYRLTREFSYEADMKGNVLDKSWQFALWIDEGRGGVTKWTNPFQMITFSIKQHFNRKKRTSNGDGHVEAVARDLTTLYHGKHWWRKAARMILKYPLFQYKYFKYCEENLI